MFLAGALSIIFRSSKKIRTMTEVPKLVKSMDDNKPKIWWIDENITAMITTGMGSTKKSGTGIGKVLAAWPVRESNVLIELLVEIVVGSKTLLRNYILECGNLLMAKHNARMRKFVQRLLAKEPDAQINGNCKLFFKHQLA